MFTQFSFTEDLARLRVIFKFSDFINRHC